MKSIVIKVVILAVCGIILYGAWKSVNPNSPENQPNVEEKGKGAEKKEGDNSASPEKK